jgi:hypothetical protein
MLAVYLHLIAFDGNFRVMFHIKKVRASQMVVAFLYAGPDVPGINLHLNRRVARVLWIKLQGAVNVLEVSADVGHHHVPGAKLRRRVPGLESPFSHLSLSFETSSTLDKYPREVLPLTVENNQSQDCYRRSQYCSARIQEHVITNDVHDHRPKQRQRERYEPVPEQERAACNLEYSHKPTNSEKGPAPRQTARPAPSA